MSCVGNVCGTGGWNGPQPGDPDNNITLSVRSVFSGLLVAWSYPLVNPNAVAYTDVYRSESSDFSKAIKLTQAGGGSYLDRLDPKIDTDYFYWIEVVSIHGTRGARIGPAMGTARPVSAQTLESLTGLIDASLLAQELKTSIAGITLNHAALIQEIKDRLANNVALQTALAAVQGGIDEALTYILNETTSRIDADGAMVTQINAIAAGLNENKAAIIEERTVRVGKDDAFAGQVVTLFAETGNNTAAIIAERDARTTRDSAMARDITTLYAGVNGNDSAIYNESIVRSNADASLASDISTLSSNFGSAVATINQTTNTLTTKVNAAASSITTVESAINGNVATGQVGLKTEVNSLSGQVNSMWYAKVNVNNLIGGFGIANDGQIVDAGFDVDRFWVGRSGANIVKPFIIDNGVTYIDKARIRNADIDTLKIAGDSVVVGAYATGGSASVAANGSVTLISRTVDLGDSSNSGLIVSGTVYCHGGSDDTMGIRIYINGMLAGNQRASMRAGYGMLLPASGFGYPYSRYATVTLEVYIPGPGSVDIVSSTMSIMGGKR